MSAVVFTCPNTDLRVQHLLDEDGRDGPDNEYEGVTCPACARLHFINRKTRQLLGDEDE